MNEYNCVTPEAEDGAEHRQTAEANENDWKVMERLTQIMEGISYLRDLFVRRLNDDKQKNAMIKKLSEGATYAFMEPFLYDIILLLDRLEKSEDDFVASVSEELYGIINRRGVDKIEVGHQFNPALYKAMKVSESPETDKLYVSGVIRNGYTFSGKVVRPAEVVVVRPAADSAGEKCRN